MDSGTKIPGVVSPATAVVLAVAASVALCVGCTERAGGGTGSGSYHCPEASPHRVGEGSGWLAVEADHFYTCALDAEGAPWCWGGAQSGRLGVGDVAADVPVPSRIEGVTGWVGLALADYFTCGWDGAGEISCWGGHIAGAVAYPPGTRAARPEPIAVREAAGTSGAADDGALAFASATIADGHTCALTPAGLAYCWAGPAADRLGVEDPPSAPELSRTVDLQHVGASSRFSDIDAGARHTCGLTTDGRVVCWGGNTWGQVGSDSAEELVRLPVEVDRRNLAEDQEFASVSTGTFHTCALDADGRAYCWGAGLCGSIGDGAAVDRRVPTAADVSRLGEGVRFASIAAGMGVTCALTEGGRPACWGAPCPLDGGQGAAGLPCARPRWLPAPSGIDPEEWRLESVTVGAEHACGITPRGTLYCWGSNRRGECGVAADSVGDGGGEAEAEGSSATAPPSAAGDPVAEGSSATAPPSAAGDPVAEGSSATAPPAVAEPSLGSGAGRLGE